VRRGRLELSMDVGDWVAKAEALPLLRFVPVDNRIALRSVLLPPPLHNDPADRIIVATALQLGATLITKDEKLRGYPHVRTVW
jgi:PIN domain nuclease of toxin-antitoxin system